MESMDILAFTYRVWTLEFWSVMGKVDVSLLFTNWLQLRRKAIVKLVMILFPPQTLMTWVVTTFYPIFWCLQQWRNVIEVHHMKVCKHFSAHELKTLRIWCIACRKTPLGSKEQEKPFLILHWAEEKITLNTTYFKYSAKTNCFTIHPVLPRTRLKWQYKPHRKKPNTWQMLVMLLSTVLKERCLGVMDGIDFRNDVQLQRQDEMVPISAVCTHTRNSLGVLAEAKFTRLQEVS